MKLTKERVEWSIKMFDWQQYRKKLRGLTTDQKLQKLHDWLVNDPEIAWISTESMRCEQVQNYLNALSRAGRIRPFDMNPESAWPLNDVKVRR